MEGRREEAILLLERAFRADPSAVGVAADLAEGYLELGRVDDARAVLATAQRPRPDDERLRELQAKLIDVVGPR
jgi:thioredoxin-like negative regulator of GroEL